VRYSDLNLGTEQGTEALYARLVSAARAVCGAPDIRDLGALVAAHACERQAVANAVRDVRSPRLSAIYSAHPRHG
jgi:UrcA family protein